MRIKIYPIFLIIICCCSLSFAAPKELKLTILHTSDIHGELIPFNYNNQDVNGLKADKTNIGGAARRATYIQQVRKETKNPVLLVDAGDTFTRGPIESMEGVPEFLIMNALKYDVMTIGNNEFKADQYTKTASPKAIDILNKRISEANFPLLAGNVYNKQTNERAYKPYIIKNIDGVRIGIFGLTATRSASYPQTVNLSFTNTKEEAAKILSELKGKTDFIILLSHAGIIEDMVLASTYPKINVILGGDTHTWLYKPLFFPDYKSRANSTNVAGVIICHVGEYGVAVGRLDLNLSRQTDGSYAVSKYSGKLVPITDAYPEDQTIKKIVDEYYKQYNDMKKAAA